MLTLNSLQWLHISFFGINTFNACKIILQSQNAGYSTDWNQFPVGQEGISSRMSMLASTEIIQWLIVDARIRTQRNRKPARTTLIYALQLPMI